MKALILNQYYSSKTQILIYSALTIVIAIFFTTFNDNPISAAIFACVYPALGAMDYLKKESASDWLKYAITMPVKRRTIVNTHFLVHFVLVMIGFIVSLIIISILKASFITGLSTSFIGLELLNFNRLFIYFELCFPTGKARACGLEALSIPSGVMLKKSVLMEMVTTVLLA
jgi:ABC-type transport system involved in multi-copper enzyme maturation permease subunit